MRCLLAALALISAEALETKPWLGEAYACRAGTWFSYEWFPRVQGASVQLPHSEQSRNVGLRAGMTCFPALDVELEGEWGQTNFVNWSLRSVALQMRGRLLNDLIGDPCSLVLGVTLRVAPTHLLRDVSTPYAAQGNAEVTLACGREYGDGALWTVRTYGWLALGQANRGYPWLRPLWIGEWQWRERHRLALLLSGAVGFGGQQGVDVHHFTGWAPYQYRSIDLGARYALKLGTWGALSVEYARRLFAHNYPMQSNHVIATYSMPFSVF
jgi:hypothetical protein